MSLTAVIVAIPDLILFLPFILLLGAMVFFGTKLIMNWLDPKIRRRILKRLVKRGASPEVIEEIKKVWDL